jgi:thioredoxin 1
MKKVIKFYADWCGPCRVYAKTFDKVSRSLREEVEFVNINIENDTEKLSKEYGVTGIPLTVVISENGEKKQKAGRMTEEKLIEFIKSE